MNQAIETNHFDALVIGAGFAGMYQLYCLREKLGLNVKVLETGDGVGGTWYWNRYPGARCDTESHAYCFTFDKDLYLGWEWSERYPGQPEIMHYMNYAANKLNLRKDIRFNTKVTSADWDETGNRWVLRTETGEQYTSTYLITAIGCLSAANVPDFPGRDGFKGDWYHTGSWPHEGVDFTGKRVGLIGTGSTGVQATPVIAEQAGHLTVFQRTPNYSVPARNKPLTEAFKQEVKETADEIRFNMHQTTSGHPWGPEPRLAVETGPKERERIYQDAWDLGGLQFRASFQDIMIDIAANETAADFVTHKIRDLVKNPESARKLTAFDHAYSTKRPIIDSHYFEAYNRDNVSLVDVKAAPIEAITANGIVTADGVEHLLDIIIFATGYDGVTGPLMRLNVTGHDGVSLNEFWKDGPKTYLGLQVAGFPNMFTITGPGSPSVLTNMPVACEQHAEWITECIGHMREHGSARVETNPAAMVAWGEKVQEAAQATLLITAKSSWYLGANVPGKPRVFLPYAGGMAKYRQICADVAANGYNGFTFSAAG
jgi:cation diffusion facilitator CzcD-associated flavoprotein CzcO